MYVFVIWALAVVPLKVAVTAEGSVAGAVYPDISPALISVTVYSRLVSRFCTSCVPALSPAATVSVIETGVAEMEPSAL